jgi:putative membrane protein, TIGR04086 family/integral membrane protein, TIGR04097 family
MVKGVHQNEKVLALFRGVLFSYIVTAFMLLLLSFLMLKLDLSGAVIGGGIIFAYIISTFIGGFFVGKKLEQKKFVWGLLMGVIYFAIVLVVCLALNRVSPLPFGNLFTTFVICSLSGMAGGMLS